MISATANRPILLVEHHTTDIFQTFHALKKNHVKNEVIVVRDGLEALDYLFGSGKYAGQTTILPEVVLLDVNLPKVGGMEVLAQIRAAERTRNLPVIFLTSSADEQDRIDSHNLGAASCLRKPVDFRNFSDAASQCGLRWLVPTANSISARKGKVCEPRGANHSGGRSMIASLAAKTGEVSPSRA